MSSINLRRLFDTTSSLAIAVSASGLLLFLPSTQPALAACTSSADSLTLNCGGSLSAPITVYDAAAAYQPTAGGNSYTPANPGFPSTGYNPAPPTVTLNFDASTQFNVTTNVTSALADRGLIAANYSNAEDPAVNNVTINNLGSISLTTSQISTSRMHAIVADSQVNVFTVNNGGAISAVQNFFGSSYDPTKLSATYSSSALTYTARYNGSGNTLNIVSALYSDDNTNSMVVNNTGSLTATGNFAAAVYGRAATTIVNSGTLGNATWTAGDTLATGHWAVGNFAGAEFATVQGSNPDTPLYAVTGIATVSGRLQGSIVIEDTAATSIENKQGATIKGDILALDTNPLTYAIASKGLVTPPLSVSASNSGPRDSEITNAGLISGSLYLGSGTHVIDNSGTIAGGIAVDQSSNLGVFAVGIAGTGAGTYQSKGPGTLNSTGGACPTAGTDTTDPYCAKTQNVVASFVGSRSVSIANSGTIAGDVTIANTTASSQVSLTSRLTGSGAGSSANSPSTNIGSIGGTLSCSGAQSSGAGREIIANLNPNSVRL